jgi:uncharacterized protein
VSSEGLNVPRETLKPRNLPHNAGEELEHGAMALEWRRRGDPETDRNLREHLFKAGAITGHDVKATGQA